MSVAPIQKMQKTVDLRVNRKRASIQRVTLGNQLLTNMPESLEPDYEEDLPDFFVVPSNVIQRQSVSSEKDPHKARANDITLLDDPLVEPSPR